MAYCKAQWNGPAQGMIDPGKEVDAAEKRINVGISTRQQETIEMTGGDFEANVAQLARENQLMEAAGLLSSRAENRPEKKEQEENEEEDQDSGEENEDDESKEIE